MMPLHIVFEFSMTSANVVSLLVSSTGAVTTALCMCTSLTPYLYPFAAQVRLQPHYVYILSISKGAVTTALHVHSTRQRLVGVKKDRSTHMHHFGSSSNRIWEFLRLEASNGGT